MRSIAYAGARSTSGTELNKAHTSANDSLIAGLSHKANESTDAATFRFVGPNKPDASANESPTGVWIQVTSEPSNSDWLQTNRRRMRLHY
jgi:hypothetical protein